MMNLENNATMPRPIDHPNRHAYTVYGYRQGSLHSLMGFNGEAHVTILDSYMLGQGYRRYSPLLMRFCSPDSWSPFRAGGINAYAYCEGDPVNHADRDGHRKVTPLVRAPLKPHRTLVPTGNLEFDGYFRHVNPIEMPDFTTATIPEPVPPANTHLAPSSRTFSFPSTTGDSSAARLMYRLHSAQGEPGVGGVPGLLTALRDRAVQETANVVIELLRRS
jgi:RHS repeat-associated protein